MVNEKSLENLKKYEKGDSAPREAQKRSAAKRKENRTLKEIMREELKKKGRKEAGILAIIEKYEKGDLAAFDRVRDLLDEKDDENRMTAPTFNLVVPTETADLLKKMTE